MLFYDQQGDYKTVFPNDKPKTIRFSKDVTSGNYIHVVKSTETSSSVSKTIASSITLPPSLQAIFVNEISSKVSVFFSMYDTGVMFPIADGNGARRNETNVSSVISATVIDHEIHNLKENITYTIQIVSGMLLALLFAKKNPILFLLEINFEFLLLSLQAQQNVSGVICVSWEFEAAGNNYMCPIITGLTRLTGTSFF